MRSHRFSIQTSLLQRSFYFYGTSYLQSGGTQETNTCNGGQVVNAYANAAIDGMWYTARAQVVDENAPNKDSETSES